MKTEADRCVSFESIVTTSSVQKSPCCNTSTSTNTERQAACTKAAPSSMIIEIEQDQDVVIEVDNPYPQIGVEVVSKGTTVSK